MKIEWMDDCEEHDFPAAESYLRLMFFDEDASQIAEQLRKAPMTQFKAKDIFRASGLPLLGIGNSHVEKNMQKIKDGKKLSPLLLVRAFSGALIVADGYHRLVTCYRLDEDAWIPCKIV